MKLATFVLLITLGGAAAFLPTDPTKVASTSLIDVTTKLGARKYANDSYTEEMSQSIPFMKRPMGLDGTMAGDFGFDPLGFAKDGERLEFYREAEMKHARLAMLATAGWPLSELLNRKLAFWSGRMPIVEADDRAPSLLNGGLGRISNWFWIGVVLLAAAVELQVRNRQNEPGYFPGNVGFDPLNLYPQDKDGQRWMQLAEIKHGRIAMIAIAWFAYQEYFNRVGVVNDSAWFFKPGGVDIGM